jgi:hypothetical protein
VKKTFLLLIAFFRACRRPLMHHANSAADRVPGFGQSQQAEDEGSAARIARIERSKMACESHLGNVQF